MISGELTREPNLPTRPRSEITARRRRVMLVVNYILDFALIAVIIAITLYLLNDSDRATLSTTHATSTVIQNTPNAQILPSDPRDAAVSSDLATVRRFREVIVRELTSVTSRLQSGTPQPNDSRRRYTLEKMLSNAGGSGLNDRIAEIEAAIRLRGSPGFNLNRDQTSIAQAIRNLHDTAISCRSGALAAAAMEIEESTKKPEAAE